MSFFPFRGNFHDREGFLVKERRSYRIICWRRESRKKVQCLCCDLLSSFSHNTICLDTIFFVGGSRKFIFFILHFQSISKHPVFFYFSCLLLPAEQYRTEVLGEQATTCFPPRWDSPLRETAWHLTTSPNRRSARPQESQMGREVHAWTPLSRKSHASVCVRAHVSAALTRQALWEAAAKLTDAKGTARGEEGGEQGEASARTAARTEPRRINVSGMMVGKRKKAKRGKR